MKQGRVIKDGSIEEVLTEETLEEIYDMKIHVRSI